MIRYELYEFKDGSFGVRAKLFNIIPVGFISLRLANTFSTNFSVNKFCKGSKAECQQLLKFLSSY